MAILNNIILVCYKLWFWSETVTVYPPPNHVRMSWTLLTEQPQTDLHIQCHKNTRIFKILGHFLAKSNLTCYSASVQRCSTITLSRPFLASQILDP